MIVPTKESPVRSVPIINLAGATADGDVSTFVVVAVVFIVDLVLPDVADPRLLVSVRIVEVCSDEDEDEEVVCCFPRSVTTIVSSSTEDT